MPFPQIDAFCLTVSATPREICVRFPVAQQVCVSLPNVNNADPSELLQAILGQINSALAPLNPIFNIIDAVIAVFDCVKAIPKAITELNPLPLIECIPNLAEKVMKLLELIPQLSLPFLIVDVIDVIIFFLETLRSQIAALQARFARILEAGIKATEPGNVALALVLDCINTNFDADLVNLNEQAAPLNRLLGILDFILELTGLKFLLSKAGVDVFPCVGSLSLDGGTPLLDLLIKLLNLIRNLIPLPGQFDITARRDLADCAPDDDFIGNVVTGGQIPGP